MKILNTLQFGVKSYFKNGPLETFKKIRFGKVSKFGKDSYYDERCDDLENGLLVMFLLIRRNFTSSTNKQCEGNKFKYFRHFEFLIS